MATPVRPRRKPMDRSMRVYPVFPHNTSQTRQQRTQKLAEIRRAEWEFELKPTCIMAARLHFMRMELHNLELELAREAEEQS